MPLWVMTGPYLGLVAVWLVIYLVETKKSNRPKWAQKLLSYLRLDTAV